MKYIDADKLIAEIEKLLAKAKNDEVKAFAKKDAAGHLIAVTKTAVCVKIKKLIASLQQERPELPPIGYAETYYQKGLRNGIIKGQIEILKGLEDIENRKAEPVLVIKEQEQPEVDIVPLQEEKMVSYINYCLQREDDECHCPTCGKFVTGLRLFPYYYDRENNDVYFASVCPECGKIIISRE